MITAAFLAEQPREAAAPAVRPNLEAALREWRTVLGADRVLDGAEAAARYGANTAGISRSIPLALVPRTSEEVQELVRIAVRHRVALYPISTGKNWGYGCALPVTDGCAIVDLSRMNRILNFDAEAGLVTVEPGVTQGMLAEYLDRHELPYMVPVTGAGPDASLLGNAMERGYGLTPHADHFAAVTRLEAVLPNGELYRSALSAAGGGAVDDAFKWGVGPYLDGLFAQGNYGIVTQVTLALAATPERIEAFFFSIPDDSQLEAAVGAVREVLTSTGGVTGSLNLMNTRRMLSMIERYPAADAPGGVMPDSVVQKLAARNGLGAWTGVGALYGPAAVVKAARGELKRILRPVARRITFLTLDHVRTARKWAARIPFVRSSRIVSLLERAEAFLLNASGRPSDIALPLAYWKSGKRPASGPLNPSRDGCGLLWYAPLVPMKPGRVREYVDMVERTCLAHGIEPLITLTSLSNRCFDSTVPLLFDRSSFDETERAHACFNTLFAAGQRQGCLPYRFGVHAMNLMVNPDHTFWKLNARIKQLIDPHQIIAPARYNSPNLASACQ